MKRNLLTLITLTICFIGFTQTFTVDGIEYEIISNGAITKSNTNTGDITIPEQVRHNGRNYNVTGIGNRSFEGNQLTSVIIPNNVTFIGKSAFENNKLTNVTIPSGVIKIWDKSFKNNKLTNVSIPNSVTLIGDSAFEDNELTNVTIGNGITIINKSTFENNKLSNLIIPNNIKIIEDNAFKNNELVTVVIGNDVRSIEDGAFYENQITSVTIGNNVRKIGSDTFRRNKLTHITIPNSVTEIGFQSFYGNELTSITFGNSVTHIGGSSFGGNLLTNITIPNSVTNIGYAAFIDNKLTSLIIPNNITTIGDRAFENNKLTSVTIGNSVTSIGEHAFTNNELTNVSISNSVTTIEEFAFYKNQLTSVTIPSSVTDIERSAFADNPISNVIAKGETPAITPGNPFGKLDGNVFFNRSTIGLVIPAGTTAAYIAAGWTRFKSLIEFTVWSGANGTNWTDTGNWNENLIASTSQNVVIPNVVTSPVISSGIIAEMNDLSIEEFSSFSIEDNGATIVNGDLNSAETITINSSATTSGTFIVKGTANGTVIFEKSGLLANEWSLITAPVSGQSIKDFVEDTANDIRVNTTVTPNRYAVAYYDDSKAEGSKWVYYTTDDLASNTISFEKGKSYIVSRATNGSILFTGNMETTDVDVNVNEDQWNTIGSPYTAYLPINANSDNNFIQENLSKLDPLYQSVYIWDASQNKYIAKTLLDTDTSLNAGQGFLIKTNTGVSSITFKESHRLPNATTTTLSRSRNRSSIRLIANQNDVQVTTKINYINNTTKGLDPGYDIGNFKGASFDVFTHLVEGNENTDFTVQSLPDSDYETTVIPIGLQSDAGKEISLTVDTDNIPANLNVYLEDTATGKFINLTKEKPYTFKTTSKLEGIGRFYLHTSSKILNTEDEIELTQNVEIVKSGKQEITIQGLAKNKQVTVSLYSVLGNEVYKKVAISQGILTIQPNRLDTGVYIVKVESLQGTITKKVIFK
ncbi:leucine-rich repeat protein [uncultured Tenacibaculum sp.]|uniref:leucine-rich repeat protein n=1 Tax=uncultured Tenacibaculum sp. TaxID=174713 RepID=UPI00263422D3|nr:leucine-rich repeat protein [uncultured Tenacibaculum sp.]